MNKRLHRPPTVLQGPCFPFVRCRGWKMAGITLINRLKRVNCSRFLFYERRRWTTPRGRSSFLPIASCIITQSPRHRTNTHWVWLLSTNQCGQESFEDRYRYHANCKHSQFSRVVRCRASANVQTDVFTSMKIFRIIAINNEYTSKILSHHVRIRPLLELQYKDWLSVY